MSILEKHVPFVKEQIEVQKKMEIKFADMAAGATNRMCSEKRNASRWFVMISSKTEIWPFQ